MIVLKHLLQYNRNRPDTHTYICCLSKRTILAVSPILWWNISVFATTFCSVVRLLDSKMVLLYSNKCSHAFIISESLSCNCLWNKKKNHKHTYFIRLAISVDVATILCEAYWLVHVYDTRMMLFKSMQIHDHDGCCFFKLAVAGGNLVLGK